MSPEFLREIPDAEGRHVLARCYQKARESLDPSTQNGAIILGHGYVLAEACNNFPRGVAWGYEARWRRPYKYSFVEHAERNAIYLAAKLGRATVGSTMYSPWAACVDCARAIIQAGIVRLVRHGDVMERHRGEDRSAEGRGTAWNESIEIADQMLKEADVDIVTVSGKVCPDAVQVLHNGMFWSP